VQMAWGSLYPVHPGFFRLGSFLLEDPGEQNPQ
jgi:hypothetical protein